MRVTVTVHDVSVREGSNEFKGRTFVDLICADNSEGARLRHNVSFSLPEDLYEEYGKQLGSIQMLRGEVLKLDVDEITPNRRGEIQLRGQVAEWVNRKGKMPPKAV